MKDKFQNTTILAIIACLLWSSAFVGIKLGLQYSPPIQFAGLRFILSGLMILPFVGGLSYFLKQIRIHWRQILLITLLQTVIHYSFFYLGISLVPGALSAIIVGASPLFITITAHFMMSDDKLSWGKVGSLFFGLIGMIFVVLGHNDGMNVEASSTTLLGIFFLMLTNLNAGFINVALKRDKKGVPPLVLSASSMLLGGTVLFLGALSFEGFSGIITEPTYYLALLWLGFMSASAFSIWFTILKRPEVKISDVNLWKFIIPVAGALLAWIVLPNESPKLLSVLGMIFTALALLWLNYQNRRAARNSNRK